MRLYSYPVAIRSAGGCTMKTTVEAANRANAVRMALVRAERFAMPVNLPRGATLGSVLAAGSPVSVGRGTFSRFA